MMDRYICKVCGYVYDPAAGDPDNGVKPGQNLKICRIHGNARFAALQKMILKKSNLFNPMSFSFRCEKDIALNNLINSGKEYETDPDCRRNL